MVASMRSYESSEVKPCPCGLLMLIETALFQRQ